MDINNLKYIVGSAEKDSEVAIRFFGPVTEDAVRTFNEEFLWLQDSVKPSCIVVKINSEGGSVMHGMSTFSIIQSCPIETHCVIEGIAASMGSVIWAAGDKQYMHDYSLLMIHNPFNSCCAGEMSENDHAVVEAFKHQLSTIYKKRFGMTKDQVKAIMDGDGEKDGTFFTAKEAVTAGFLHADNIIKTSKAMRDKVKSEIGGVKDIASIRDIMASISIDDTENKLIEEEVPIHEQENNTFNNNPKAMETNEMNFDAISALLGLQENTQMSGVTARIAELTKAESELKEVNAKFTELQIQFKGKEAEVANMQTELDNVKASLKKYQDAEQAAFEAKVEQTVDAAIQAGKIEDSAKEAWVKMAHADFATVEATLNSIQARETITEEIAKEPENVEHIKDTLEDVEAKAAAKVEKVLGGKFELKKF